MLISADPDSDRMDLLPDTLIKSSFILDGSSQEEACDILTRNFSRVFRKYVGGGFNSRENFLSLTSINRGHLGAMANGKVDPKMTMLFRCTRDVGGCPSQLVCDLCSRSYRECQVSFNSKSVPADVRTMRDMNAFLLRRPKDEDPRE